MQHGDREHATWSASATERNFNCAGALALTKDLPDTTSEAADWGTCCHQIAEKCLTDNRDPAEWLGETVKGKKHKFEVDEEMVETTQVYVDYVRSRNAPVLMIEQRFSLSRLNPPFDAGGTGDAVLYFPDERLLEIVDLKGGRGVNVKAAENMQLRTYALGAMLANPDFKAVTVRSTIIQPRTDPEPKFEEFDVVELLEWTNDLLAAMQRSATALKDRALRQKDGSIAVWNAEWLRPGAWCSKTFCKAQGFCPALKQKALDAASVWFDESDTPRLANSPDDMTPDALAQALDSADLIEGWISAVRSYAHAMAETGVPVPNYVLVERVGRRKWRDENEAVTRLSRGGYDPYTRKPISPAQAEKLLGKKEAGLIADLIETPSIGTNLVRADKTKRKAIAPAVDTYFQSN